MQSNSCAKCGHAHFEKGEIRATGGLLSKIFDVQNKKFATVTCKQCGYTEMYKEKTGTAENVLDFFTR